MWKSISFTFLFYLFLTLICIFQISTSISHINNHIMRTKCPDMKQTTLEREFHKLSLNATKLILTYAQFCLFLPCHLTYTTQLYTDKNRQLLHFHSIFLHLLICYPVQLALFLSSHTDVTIFSFYHKLGKKKLNK